MAFGDITREAVLAAIAEYDQLGQEEFLRRYGFDRARQYILVYGGKRYDSKAIVGAAHGFLPGETALTADEFSGGRATVVRLLGRLGFHVEASDERLVDTLVRQRWTEAENWVPFDELQSVDLVLDRTYRGGTSGSVADDPLNRLIPVGNQGGFRYKGSAEAPLLIALYTTGAEDDWPDSLDPSTSTFTYYGDNRAPGRALLDTPRHGNEILYRTFARAHSDPQARAQVAPHLLFAKAGRGRDIVFRGLLAPGGRSLTADEDLVVISHDRQGSELRNYQAKFTVLDSERVTRAWLNDVLAGEPLSDNCPDVWRQWVARRVFQPLVLGQSGDRIPAGLLPPSVLRFPQDAEERARADPEPFQETLEGFCERLKRLQQAAGVTQANLALAVQMSRSQVSGILNGKIRRPPTWAVVDGLVRSCLERAEIADQPVPPDLRDRGDWQHRHHDLELYFEAENRQRDRIPPEGAQAGRPLADATDPFVLGVHVPMQPDAPRAGLPPLPPYVPRDHDRELADVTRAAASGTSGVAVLAGGLSTGKTRSCWEAMLRDLSEPWRLWHPISPSRPEAALQELPLIGPRTVVWLDDAQALITDRKAGEEVAAGLLELLRDPARAPVLVLATLSARYWGRIADPSAPGQPHPHEQARELLLAGRVIVVPDALSAAEQERAIATADPRLTRAVAEAEDGRVIQFLAGAPLLMARHGHAPLAAFGYAASGDLRSYVREFTDGPLGLDAVLNAGRLPFPPEIADQSPDLAGLAARIWRITSADSPMFRQLLDTDQQPRDVLPQQSDDGDTTEAAPDAPPEGAHAQEHGELLEGCTLSIVQRLFQIEPAAWKQAKFRTEAMRQNPGTQDGADIVIRFKFKADAIGPSSTCLVECKNFIHTKLTWNTVAKKIQQAETRWGSERIDHWILISPHRDPESDLVNFVEQWNNEPFKHDFTLQIWSPKTDINDLFSIEPAIYSRLYGVQPPEPRPDAADIIEEFSRRLKPPVRLPESLRGYILHSTFADKSERVWLKQIGTQIKRSGFDDKGARLSRPLEDEITSVLVDSPRGSDVVLLLAEFGEGKSFLTVSLCHQLRERYLQRGAGPGSPIPVRLHLSSYRMVSHPSDFLRYELGLQGLSLAEFGELQRGDILVVLDGLDEMSVEQSQAAMRINLNKIGSLLRELEGFPVLITSRPHFFSSSRDRQLLYDQLRKKPHVFIMSQPGPREIMDHLREYAESHHLTIELEKLKELYDPIGLAGKVLFLEMIKVSLSKLSEDRSNELRENEFNEETLYENYVWQSLERKIDLLPTPRGP